MSIADIASLSLICSIQWIGTTAVCVYVTTASWQSFVHIHGFVVLQDSTYTFTVSVPIVAGWSFCNVYYPSWKALKCGNFTVLAMWVVFIDAKSEHDSIDYALPYCIILNDSSFKFYGSPQIISFVIALWWSIVGNSWRTALSCRDRFLDWGRINAGKYSWVHQVKYCALSYATVKRRAGLFRHTRKTLEAEPQVDNPVNVTTEEIEQKSEFD